VRNGKVFADELTPLSERLRWLQLYRALLMGALPLLGWALSSPPAVVHRLDAVATLWLAMTAFCWALSTIGRRVAFVVLTIALLGDGVVLVMAWTWLGGLAGPIGIVVIVHAIVVTLVATFRTGMKMTLWHSLLAVFVLEMHATGLLQPTVAFPYRAAWIYLASLWTAAVATASLAAVNERELRRRRYDEQALRVLALATAAADSPRAVAATLARFAVNELGARRSAVIITSTADFAAQLGPDGVAARAEEGRHGKDIHLTAIPGRQHINDDEVRMFHRLDPATDAWLAHVLPDAVDVIAVPLCGGEIDGVFALEYGRPGRRRPGRVQQRLIMTARQAATQTSAAAGRSVAVAALAAAAHTDGLTGLVNRARFDVLLSAFVADERPFAVVLIDLDNFKSVNDTFGHQTGDRVLQGVADALRTHCSANDVVARYGGEELVVIAAIDPIETAAYAERLRFAIATANTPVPITASLGAAWFPVDESEPAGLLDAADRRLYIAKRTGRNRAIASAADARRAGEAVADHAPAGTHRPPTGSTGTLRDHESPRTEGLHAATPNPTV
jgi:diguanylate cyclase (GGDEF)-like protein